MDINNKPLSLLDKIKCNQNKTNTLYLLPNTILCYNNINTNYLLNCFNYYSQIDIVNICIVINNYSETLYKISKLFNITLYDFKELNNLIQSKKFNFIANFNNELVISNDFFKSKQLQKIYTNNIFTNNTIKPIDGYYYEYNKINKFIIKIEHENILPKLKIYSKNIINSNILNYKSTIHNFFEHIYVLNLSRRPDRLNNTISRMKMFNINNIEHFLALDGKNNEIELLYKYYLNLPNIKNIIKNNKPHIRSSGSFAILLSMKNMILDAIQHNYKNILVLQDDVFIIKNFNNILSKYSEIIKGNWKLLFLGANDKKSIQNIKNLQNNLYYYTDGLVDGAFSIAIHHSIFKEIINIIDTFILPFDSGPLRKIQTLYPLDCYIFYPNLMIADVTNSDCRESRNQQIFSKKLSWNLNNYIIKYEKNIINLTIIIYDNFDIFNKNMLDYFYKIPYNIIILTTQSDNYIHEQIRIYKIKKYSLIKDINMGIIYSYSNNISINVLNINNCELIKISKPKLKSYYLKNNSNIDLNEILNTEKININSFTSFNI